MGKFGRGGTKKAGGVVYSETDNVSDKITKSFAHILTGLEPGAYTTGKKIVGAIEGDVRKGGDPYNLQDEGLALLSGIRIINVDAPKSMQYKITEFQRDKRSVTTAEDFYSLKNAIDRTPNELMKEFRQIQDESFRVQQDFYITLQNALKMGLTKKDLRRIMKDRGMGVREMNMVLRGKMEPGYQQGNMVQPNVMPAAMPMDQGPAQDSPVQDLSFEELRSRLPESITNDVVQLIANSQQALVEFANIQTQQDVKEFNRKYEVNLVLQMHYLVTLLVVLLTN